MITNTYMPNRTPTRQWIEDDGNWRLIASDGTAHTSYAALGAAGKVPWPGDTEQFPTGVKGMSIRTRTSANANGDEVLYKLNQLNWSPSDDTCDGMVGDSGQTMIEPGGIKSLWLKKTTSTDRVYITGRY